MKNARKMSVKLRRATMFVCLVRERESLLFVDMNVVNEDNGTSLGIIGVFGFLAVMLENAIWSRSSLNFNTRILLFFFSFYFPFLTKYSHSFKILFVPIVNLMPAH